MTKAKKADEKMSESTEVAVITAEEQAYLDSVSEGRAGGSQNAGVPRLVINTKAKDADGNKRPIGGWHITGTDKYFDGVAKFRPIRFYNKLINYEEDDSKNWHINGESIYFKDFSQQIFDTKGGLALGRKFGKGHSDADKAATKDNADVYLDIFGLVQFDGAEWIPVLYRVRGTKLMKMINVFKAVPKDKTFSEYSYSLETNQPEGKTYWDMNVQIDTSTRLRISDILQYDKEIVAYVANADREIMKKHMSARSDGVATGFAAAADKAIDVTDVELDDDELPF